MLNSHQFSFLPYLLISRVRNPFVDYPFLAQQFFDPPRQPPAANAANNEIYEHCADIPTSAPTFEPNGCEEVDPGDMYIFMLNSDEPDQIAIFLMTDLEKGFQLYMTDKAFDGTEFVDGDEGTVMVRRLLLTYEAVLLA
jgi:hypothetical protein